MAGRAGRAGIDTQGEAILMANNAQLGKQLLELMQVICFPGFAHAILLVVSPYLVEKNQKSLVSCQHDQPRWVARCKEDAI